MGVDELGEDESVDEALAAIHAWLTSVYGELRKIRRLVVAGLVVAVIAAVLIAVGVTVLVTEFGLD